MSKIKLSTGGIDMSKQAIFASLTDKQNQLAKRISAIEADFKKGRSQDFSEQATETENDGVLDEIHHEAKLELGFVNEALQRLANDTYGFCAICETKINPKRLAALPYSKTCIECAQ
jgi:RNA polymerase-binding transcription factor DksA